jgi:hypothetical protein
MAFLPPDNAAAAQLTAAPPTCYLCANDIGRDDEGP